MVLQRSDADLVMDLTAEAHAPCEARQAVAEVDNPSPDLRDAVSLLVSSLVTRACREEVDRQGRPEDPSEGARASRPAGERIQLRAWMPHSVVRVEIAASHDPLQTPFGPPDMPDYDRELLEALADRWGIEHPQGQTLVWFEIDRQGEP